jgi:hypothetical protein
MCSVPASTRPTLLFRSGWMSQFIPLKPPLTLAQAAWQWVTPHSRVIDSDFVGPRLSTRAQSLPAVINGRR